MAPAGIDLAAADTYEGGAWFLAREMHEQTVTKTYAGSAPQNITFATIKKPIGRARAAPSRRTIDDRNGRRLLVQKRQRLRSIRFGFGPIGDRLRPLPAIRAVPCWRISIARVPGVFPSTCPRVRKPPARYSISAPKKTREQKLSQRAQSKRPRPSGAAAMMDAGNAAPQAKPPNQPPPLPQQLSSMRPRRVSTPRRRQYRFCRATGLVLVQPLLHFGG